MQTVSVLAGTLDYERVRAHTEALAAPLSPEDQTVQSMPDVSPTKWHRAHTTWFFEEFVLGRYAPEYASPDPIYGFLFNSYYEAAGPRYPRSQRGLVTRPGVGEVGAYRAHVDAAMTDLWAGMTDPIRPELAKLVELGLNHEQQHQELLLMDIKHVLSLNPLAPAYAPISLVTSTPPRPPRWIGHDGGLVEAGHEGQGFCYDNERPRHSVWLEPFAVTDRLVTAGDWLAFMDDGGYRRADLWLSDGWQLVQASGWEAPLYWERDDGEWFVFTLGGRVLVDPGTPVVHISYYEADAFARWAGARLPTEAEWEAAAAATGNPIDAASPLHPAPADNATTGLQQLYGHVWQWTGSAYLPYPRFEAEPGAVGEYNGKFMVNQHVLRGSAAITPPGHARITYRNFFPPSARWAFSGLRLARYQ